jgi:hypothetical protein
MRVVETAGASAAAKPAAVLRDPSAGRPGSLPPSVLTGDAG